MTEWHINFGDWQSRGDYTCHGHVHLCYEVPPIRELIRKNGYLDRNLYVLGSPTKQAEEKFFLFIFPLEKIFEACLVKCSILCWPRPFPDTKYSNFGLLPQKTRHYVFFFQIPDQRKNR